MLGIERLSILLESYCNTPILARKIRMRPCFQFSSSLIATSSMQTVTCSSCHLSILLESYCNSSTTA
ncbi:hypothetical protein TAM4_2414 [Thermococcus sp. AM4]|nr:hypothetical protein TAM4_2414 [Thermococcus sp. AM4]